MSHPTPWQLELHALGESIPEVANHLPCPTCDAVIARSTADPGPVPAAVRDAARPRRPTWTVSPRAVGLAAAASALLSAVGAGLYGMDRWSTPQPAEVERTLAPVAQQRTVDSQNSPAKDPVDTDDPEASRAEDVPDPEAGGVNSEPEPFVGVQTERRQSGTPVSAAIGEAHAYNPTWSADGEHLAFEVNDFGNRSDVWIWSGDRATQVNLPGGGGPFGGHQVVVNPSWHASDVVVFEGSNAGGQFRLYYSLPGGGAASELISSREIPGDLTFPAGDADASMLAFVAGRTGNGDIQLRDTNTGRTEVLVESPAAELHPAFDQDGSELLFTRREDGDEDIFAVDLASGEERIVRSGPGDQTRPVAAEDDAVVYFAQQGDTWSIEAVQDGKVRTLAEEVRLPLRARPAISPDGAWVAFAYEDPRESDALVFVRVDGSEQVSVHTDLVAVGEPAIGARDERWRVAYTGLPDVGADFRRLYWMDVELTSRR